MGLRELKGKKKIVVLTVYDFLSAKICASAGLDALLIGDSLGMVIKGDRNTHKVVLDDVLYHTEAVRKGAKDSLLISDLPINSYNTPKDAILNSKKLIASGADIVKLEGFKPEIFKALKNEKIRTMTHLGLTPQLFGSFKIQGKDNDSAEKIFSDSIRIDDFDFEGMVLECIPLPLAKKISETIKTPTIGIGAGKYCDGQVLVFHDMLGFDTSFNPKFLKRYANLEEVIGKAIKSYKTEVENSSYPDEEHSYE